MEALEQLPPKRAAFVREYTKDHNATQAAIRAGYSEKTAQEQSSRLLSNVMVREAVSALEQEYAENCSVTVEGLTEDLRAVYTDAKSAGQHSAAVSAVAQIAKLHGLETAQRANENAPVSFVVEAPRKEKTPEDWLKAAGKHPDERAN